MTTKPTPRRRRFALADVGLLAEASLALGTARLAFAVWPLRRAVRVLETVWAPAAPDAPRAEAERVVWAVAVAAGRLRLGRTCLPRAAATHAILRRRGHRAELRIGFRRDGAALLGHAWVEVDGRELPGSADSEAWSALAPAGGAARPSPA